MTAKEIEELVTSNYQLLTDISAMQLALFRLLILKGILTESEIDKELKKIYTESRFKGLEN